MLTRYVIGLAEGGTLTAVRQNLDTAAAQALQSKGRSVRVSLAGRPDLRDPG